MEKRRSFYLLIFTLVLVMDGKIFISETIANPLPGPEVYNIGGIVTKTITFNLTNAEVVFDIDSTDFKNNIGISFDGNYTIFNPNNKSEIIIYAPFSVEESVVNSNVTVEVNSTQISFDVGNAYDFGIEDWVWNYSLFELWTYIKCNITIPENSSQTIRYKFDGLISKPLGGGTGEFSINYDLETSNAWSGNITERVEFRVHGKLPDRYSEYTRGVYEDRCIITDIDHGKIYSWEWNNERINTLQVGIMYISSFNWLRTILIAVGITVPISIIIITFVLIRRRRSRRL
ncbi:MAG: hypothetical protein ACFFA3_21735 [Promethearchaeota archaeon]